MGLIKAAVFLELQWEKHKAMFLVTLHFLLHSKRIFQESYSVSSKLLKSKFSLIETNLIVFSVWFFKDKSGKRGHV